MREEILNTALSLTETVLAKTNEVLEVAESCEEKKLLVANLEAEFMRHIVGDTDDKGKPRFSNETARNAELVYMKSCSTHVIEAEAFLKTESVKKSRLQNELEKYRSQLSLYKAFLNGGAA